MTLCNKALHWSGLLDGVANDLLSEERGVLIVMIHFQRSFLMASLQTKVGKRLVVGNASPCSEQVAGWIYTYAHILYINREGE